MRRQEQFVDQDQSLVILQVWNPTVMKFLEIFVRSGDCRPQNVTPPRSVQWRMRVAFVIAMCVMLPVISRPVERRTFARQSANDCQCLSNPVGTLETCMRQQSVIPKANTNSASDPVKEQAGDQTFPAEKEGSHQAADVDYAQPDGCWPV